MYIEVDNITYIVELKGIKDKRKTRVEINIGNRNIKEDIMIHLGDMLGLLTNKVVVGRKIVKEIREE